jgi:tetratricopeptide (TPR) repeat protein
LLDAERKLHRKHPVVLKILGSMAWSLYQQERLEESLAWYIWLQRVRKNVLGRSHYSTMGALKGIAEIYLKKGRLEEAEEMFLTAYHEREKVLGTNDSLTINAQYSLLRVLEIRYKGKNGDIAQEHQKRVIEFLVTIYRANEKFLGKIIWWNMTFTLWIPLQWDIKRQRITTKL